MLRIWTASLVAREKVTSSAGLLEPATLPRGCVRGVYFTVIFRNPFYFRYRQIRFTLNNRPTDIAAETDRYFVPKFPFEKLSNFSYHVISTGILTL